MTKYFVVPCVAFNLLIDDNKRWLNEETIPLSFHVETSIFFFFFVNPLNTYDEIFHQENHFVAFNLLTGDNDLIPR